MTDPDADPHDPRTLEDRILSGYFPFLWRAALVLVLIYVCVRIALA